MIFFQIHLILFMYPSTYTLSFIFLFPSPPYPPFLLHLTCLVLFLSSNGPFLPVSTDIPSYTHESKSLKSCVLISAICSVFACCVLCKLPVHHLFFPITSWSSLIFPWGLSIASSILSSLMGMHVFIQFIMETFFFFPLSMTANSFPG